MSVGVANLRWLYNFLLLPLPRYNPSVITKDATGGPRGGTPAPLPTPRGLTGALQSAIGAKTKATAAGGLGFEFTRWP